MLNSNWKLS